MPLEEGAITGIGCAPYRDDDVRSFVQKSAAMPLAFVWVAWRKLKDDASQLVAIDEYIAYFQSTWIDGNFLPRTWNYYTYEGPRTNNHLKGWHNRLKFICGKAHPDFLEFIELLQKEQVSMELAGGRQRRARRKKLYRVKNVSRDSVQNLVMVIGSLTLYFVHCPIVLYHLAIILYTGAFD